MSMTAQTKRKMTTWGTAVAIVTVAAFFIASSQQLVKHGGEIAITRATAFNALFVAQEANTRTHDIDKRQAAIMEKLSALCDGVSDIKDELRAQRVPMKPQR